MAMTLWILRGEPEIVFMRLATLSIILLGAVMGAVVYAWG